MNRKHPLTLTALSLASMSACALDVDLSKYTLSARYALPEPTRTGPPVNNLLAQEASAVTWNRDTNTLFIVGDGSTAIVQVRLTGALINTMTLAQDPTKPQGTAYYDTEGLTYLGNGQFVIVEERDRVVSRFTYTAGTTLAYADSQHIKLGTTVGNIGIEGISYDPLTGGILAVKEKTPAGVFSTTLNFAAGTVSNGSATTVNSTNLFDPTLAGLLDFAEVFALSALGNVSAADQQHEGLTMDDAGNLYTVAENGGGDINHPELWVYTSAAAVPEAQTSAMLLAGLGLLTVAARRRAFF